MRGLFVIHPTAGPGFPALGVRDVGWMIGRQCGGLYAINIEMTLTRVTVNYGRSATLQGDGVYSVLKVDEHPTLSKAGCCNVGKLDPVFGVKVSPSIMIVGVLDC